MSHFKTIRDAIKLGKPKLTDYQLDIVEECMTKDTFGLSLHMGSGKTFISLMVALKKKLKTKNTNPILVVVSLALTYEWISEIKKFFGQLIKYQIVNTGNKVDFVIDEDTHIVFINAEKIANIYRENNINTKFITKELYEPPDGGFPTMMNIYHEPTKRPFLLNATGRAMLFSIDWACLIVDEAHEYTNIDTKGCQGICSIFSKYRMLLSGTMINEPKPNRLLGYFVMLHSKEFKPRNVHDTTLLFVMKRKYSSNQSQKSRFYMGDYDADYYDADYYEQSEGNYVSSLYKFNGIRNSLVFRDKNELTSVKVNKHIVSHDLSYHEGLIYSTMREVLESLRKQHRLVKDRHEKSKFASYLLSVISHIRQGVVVSIIPIANIVLEMSDISKKKSELTKLLNDKFDELDLVDYLDDPNSARSTRISETIDIIKKHNKNTDKIIIFSCFSTSINMLEYYIKQELDVEVYRITGNMSSVARGRMIDNFRNSDNNSVFLTTYELGAEGINLQCANVGIILDVWWNKAKTDQAISRIVRQGQQNQEVDIYFLTSNTGIENGMYIKQDEKLDVLDFVMNGKDITKPIKTLKIDEILKLVDTVENKKYVQKLYINN